MGHLVQYQLHTEDRDLFEKVRAWCEGEFDGVEDDGVEFINFEAYHPYSYDLALDLEEQGFFGVEVSAWYLDRDPDAFVVTSKDGGGLDV